MYNKVGQGPHELTAMIIANFNVIILTELKDFLYVLFYGWDNIKRTLK